MNLPDLSHLGPIDEDYADFGELRGELFYFIEQAIRDHPRSQQVALGPSELGTPCARRIGYKLAGVAEVNPRDTAWKPTVGTAVHAWLEETFTAVNRALGEPRFLLEHRVDVGEINGTAVTGHCDLYDRATGTVVDWKIVGVSSLRKYTKGGPGEQYRTQAHLYGRGWVRRGMPVTDVAIFFLPQNGELSEAHVWHEPYNEHIAVGALARVEAITNLVDGAGRAALPLLPTGDAWCQYCPWWMPASTVLTDACPGHAGTPAHVQTSAAPAAATQPGLT